MTAGGDWDQDRDGDTRAGIGAGRDMDQDGDKGQRHWDQNRRMLGQDRDMGD